VKIVIVGCGRVGASAAESWDKAGHEVVIVDLSTRAFERLPSTFGGTAIRGDGTDEDVLRRVGAEGADVSAQLAVEAFEIPSVVAKINDPVRAAAYSQLGIATLCRTGLMVDALDAHLGLPPSGLPGMLSPSGTHPGGEHHATRVDDPAAADTTTSAPDRGAGPATAGPDSYSAALPSFENAAPGAAKEA
jgi:trk system potassium uptake protein